MAISRSQFLLGVAGWAIVMVTLVGGMSLAGLLHHLVTPNHHAFYSVWLWVCLIPFGWLCVTTLGDECTRYPVATYIGLLPFGLIMHYLLRQFEPGDYRQDIVLAGGILVLFAIARLVVHRRLCRTDTNQQ